jgi:hypothetical protein
VGAIKSLALARQINAGEDGAANGSQSTMDAFVEFTKTGVLLVTCADQAFTHIVCSGCNKPMAWNSAEGKFRFAALLNVFSAMS